MKYALLIAVIIGYLWASNEDYKAEAAEQEPSFCSWSRDIGATNTPEFKARCTGVSV